MVLQDGPGPKALASCGHWLATQVLRAWFRPAESEALGRQDFYCVPFSADFGVSLSLKPSSLEMEEAGIDSFFKHSVHFLNMNLFELQPHTPSSISQTIICR